jgi:hypothetical protein
MARGELQPRFCARLHIRAVERRKASRRFGGFRGPVWGQFVNGVLSQGHRRMWTHWQKLMFDKALEICKAIHQLWRMENAL